ncbi:MAG: radical SAM protein [Thermoprotei archaeon]|nr:radical SAM protein [Thermoprotei archaeon]
MKRKKRGGVGALLVSFRVILANPFVRLLLKGGLKDYDCLYEGRTVKASALYHALAMYAGESVQCPVAVRFLGGLIKMLLRLGMAVMHGREEEAKKALKDPAVRRGVSVVLKGIALYGVTVPQRLPAPFMIVWNFTNMCNLRCKHCYQRADRPLPNELTLKEKLMVVDQLDKVGVAAVALSGGEPTIHPHFLPVVKAISTRGMYPAVATNGWVFADSTSLKKAVKAGLRYVEVSVDSADPKKHDWFRGVQGSWERAVKALTNTVKLGVSHAMAVTITKLNVNEVEDLLDLAESIGVRRVAFFNFIPVGRGRKIINLDLSPEEREEFLRTLYHEMKRRGLEIVSTAPQYGRVITQLSGRREAAPTHFYVGGDPIVKALAEFVGGCGAGRIYAAIEPDGTVTPCVFMPMPVGNLRAQGFWEIWTGSELLKALRDRSRLKGFCSQCPYKYVCGGCRARAYAYTGDPLGPDPGCVYNLSAWRSLVREAMNPYQE